MPGAPFQFKQFAVQQDRCALKLGTDSLVLGAWVDVHNAERILDIGTGTGVLALMAAQRSAKAWVDAIEIDESSAEQANENIANSPWKQRMRVHQMDARRMHASEPYDLVICNPPFYAGEMTAADVRTSLAKHSAELSFEDLIEVVARVLVTDGRLAVIVPKDRERTFVQVAECHAFYPQRTCSLHYVEARPTKRVLMELGRQRTAVATEELVVEHVPGSFTQAYRDLLAPFLLKF